MPARAMEGARLASLVRMAAPICRAAQRQCPRTGPGRPPDFEDWQIAVLIVVAILSRRKSKSAQYRFVHERRRRLQELLQMNRFPSRGTYFNRYTTIHSLLPEAIFLQGRKALAEGVATARSVSVDKSLLGAKGPQWHAQDRRAGRIPQGLRGVDRQSTWSCSKYHGWVQGYSYEVVVTADPGTILPLLASVDTASASEHVSFAAKIDQLPHTTRHVLADSGYDNQDYAQRIEWDRDERRTGRRWLCPQNPRRHGNPPAPAAATAQQRHARQRRQRRRDFYASPQGQQIYQRRSQSVEPFNEWFKSLFALDQTVWHRGLANNQTQLLTAIFSYQLLLRYNHRIGRCNGQIQWILDTL